MKTPRSPMPDLAYLHACFNVEGQHLVSKSRGRPVGTKRKYLLVRVLGKQYRVHRIIWFMETGQDPGDMLVDHINGDTHDNRIENLRLCSDAQSARHIGLSKHNTTGLRGVTRKGNRFKAQIQVNGQTIYLGLYLTAAAAALAFDAARIKYFGEFSGFQHDNEAIEALDRHSRGSLLNHSNTPETTVYRRFDAGLGHQSSASQVRTLLVTPSKTPT